MNIQQLNFIHDILGRDKDAYLLRECEDSHVYLWVMPEGFGSRIGMYDTLLFEKHFPKEMHEKVYLRDLLDL